MPALRHWPDSAAACRDRARAGLLEKLQSDRSAELEVLTYLPTYVPTYLLTYRPTYLPSYLLTYLLTAHPCGSVVERPAYAAVLMARYCLQDNFETLLLAMAIAAT